MGSEEISGTDLHLGPSTGSEEITDTDFQLNSDTPEIDQLLHSQDVQTDRILESTSVTKTNSGKIKPSLL